ncbi:MAG TPA: hypothetical protein VGK73_26895 [Polyangiaceae bacterium]
MFRGPRFLLLFALTPALACSLSPDFEAADAGSGGTAGSGAGQVGSGGRGGSGGDGGGKAAAGTGGKASGGSGPKGTNGGAAGSFTAGTSSSEGGTAALGDGGDDASGGTGGSGASSGSDASGGSGAHGGSGASGGAASGAAGSGGSDNGGSNNGGSPAGGNAGFAGSGPAGGSGGAIGGAGSGNAGTSSGGNAGTSSGGSGGQIGGCDNQLLKNADFEAGPGVAWREESDLPGLEIIVHRSSAELVQEGVTPFGNYLAWLGGIPDNEFDRYDVILRQDVTIPPNANTLTLTGRYWIKTEDALDDVYDVSYLEFEDDNGVVWQAQELTNLDFTSGWTALERTTLDLDGLAGRTVTFVAYSRTDLTGKTSFFYDSLRLEAGCGR